jgi:alpha-tubulin suppressor-like RCC1 family protein
VFKINQSDKKDNFFFSTLKKAANENCLFSVKAGQPEILVSYPQMNKFSVGTRIVGLSIGQFHKLCWDANGKLYSWGCKSLALGH